MAEFTKGEWKVYGNAPRFRISINGKSVATIMSTSSLPNEQKEGNAHLIAAAPDMYKALKEMLNIFDRGLRPDCLGRSACDDAIKALSKAEGK